MNFSIKDVDWGSVNNARLTDAVNKLAAKYKLASELLDEKQIAEAVRQAILAGDFDKLVCADKQAIRYIPYQGVEDLRSENQRLKSLLDTHVPGWKELTETE